jgi:hypothetical protein
LIIKQLHCFGRPRWSLAVSEQVHCTNAKPPSISRRHWRAPDTLECTSMTTGPAEPASTKSTLIGVTLVNGDLSVDVVGASRFEDLSAISIAAGIDASYSF